MAEIYCCMVKNYEQGRYECWSKRLVSSIRCSCCSSHSRTTDEPPIDVGHYVTSSAVQHDPMFPVSTQTGNFRLPSLVWFKKAHFLPCLKRMKDEKNAGKHMLYNNRHCLRIAAVPMWQQQRKNNCFKVKDGVPVLSDNYKPYFTLHHGSAFQPANYIIPKSPLSCLKLMLCQVQRIKNAYSDLKMQIRASLIVNDPNLVTWLSLKE